jgi:hypothetical protein
MQATTTELRDDASGVYLLDQEHSHLEAHFGPETRKFGYTKQLCVRYLDTCYTTYAAPGSVRYALTCETPTAEDAARLEGGLKTVLQATPELAPCIEAHKEFVRMSVSDFEKLVRVVAQHLGVSLTAVCHAPRYKKPIVDPTTKRRPPPTRRPTIRDVVGDRAGHQEIADVVARALHRRQTCEEHAAAPHLEYVRSEFQLFLESHAVGKNGLPLSERNVAQVMLAAHKLATGEGHTAPLWSASFRPGQPVALVEELERVKAAAIEFTKRHGVDPDDARLKEKWTHERTRAKRQRTRFDRSNGWTLTHPLQKMIEYKAWKLRLVAEEPAT